MGEMAARLPRVAIVGAGIAGLAAAEKLYKGGLTNLTLLEATDHVGGRIRTHWVENGASRYRLELGATWIHGIDDNVIMQYVNQHHLEIVEDAQEEITSNMALALDEQGRTIPLDVVLNIYNRVDAALEKAAGFYQKPDREDMASLVADIGLQDFVEQELAPYLQTLTTDECKLSKTILQHRMIFETSIVGCHHMNEISTRQFGSQREHTGAHQIHKHGYQRLVDAIAEGVPSECIRRKHAVKSIKLAQNSDCDQSQNLVADDPHCHASILAALQRQKDMPLVNGSSFSSRASGNSDPSEHSGNGPVTGRCWPASASYRPNTGPMKGVHRTSVDDQHVIITCENGHVMQADHVIVTSSLGYLKEHACDLFLPALPEPTLAAISRLNLGVVDKLYLEFDDVDFMEGRDEILFFNDKYHPESGDVAKNWVHKILGFHIEPTTRPWEKETTVTFWLTGEEAKYVEQLPDVEVMDSLLTVMTYYLKREIPTPRKILRTCFYSNPYMRGSYTHVPLGATAEDIRTLAEPIVVKGTNKPLIQFAGEATHECFYSTVHGAIMTGFREAKRLLELYKPYTRQS